jgi:hypothetical protein
MKILFIWSVVENVVENTNAIELAFMFLSLLKRIQSKCKKQMMLFLIQQIENFK